MAHDFGLSLQPGGVLEFGVVMHVVMADHSDHPSVEVERIGEPAFDAVLQLVVEDGIDLLICGFLFLVNGIEFDKAVGQ
jgi:hypothetical protein